MGNESREGGRKRICSSFRRWSWSGVMTLEADQRRQKHKPSDLCRKRNA